MRSTKAIAIIVLILCLIGDAFAAQNQQIQEKLAALEKMQGKFSFIVLGDNRSGDEVYRKIISRAVERKPDFIMHTGDMIMSSGDKGQWANFWELSRPITVPYFLTVGNHDVSFSRNRSSEQIYKEQVDLPGNELYYRFSAGNALFVVLDAQLKSQEKKITGEQYQWLEGVLATSTQKHKFVFVHYPLYPQEGKGSHYGNSLDRYPEDRDRLQKLFQRYRVTTVFNGHEHLYSRKSVDGILHVITGGGGAPLYASDADGGFYHFVQVTVHGDNVSAEVIDINGRVRDRFSNEFGVRSAE